MREAPSMAVIYVGSCPYDPETELENFRRKQTEYEVAYHRTGDPLVLHEALQHAKAARQLTPDWLMEALGDHLGRSRTDHTAERLQDRMRHVRRYRCVRDLRGKGLIKGDALDQAVVALAATDAAAERGTIENSYDRVSRDLKRPKSEYFLFVAQSDPTVVPVCVSRTQSGELIINGVIQRTNRP
jgi:hypothetical protein